MKTFEEFSLIKEKLNVTKEEFVDEFLDRLYMNGTKENEKYILTLSQATTAANEMYDQFLK